MTSEQEFEFRHRLFTLIGRLDAKEHMDREAIDDTIDALLVAAGEAGWNVSTPKQPEVIELNDLIRRDCQKRTKPIITTRYSSFKSDGKTITTIHVSTKSDGPIVFTTNPDKIEKEPKT